MEEKLTSGGAENESPVLRDRLERLLPPLRGNNGVSLKVQKLRHFLTTDVMKKNQSGRRVSATGPTPPPRHGPVLTSNENPATIGLDSTLILDETVKAASIKSQFPVFTTKDTLAFKTRLQTVEPELKVHDKC